MFSGCPLQAGTAITAKTILGLLIAERGISWRYFCDLFKLRQC